MGTGETRFLGITVLSDFILSEGINRVLDNLTAAGVTAVALNPTVTEEAEEGQGSFQPPDDAGSSPRLFDRPLFGKKSLWVRSAPSYRPNEDYYADSPYPARRPNELTDARGSLVGEFIDAAVERGFEVYFQISGTAPSGLRDEDTPRLPDGSIPENRMAATGSLAADAVREFNRAYIRDLLATYPRISGFRPDWPEYPCYKLCETFQDFGPHVDRWARRHGFPFDEIRREVGEFYRYLHGRLKNADLEEWAGPERGTYASSRLMRSFPGIGAWLRLKAALSVDLLTHWREAITDAGGADKTLSANAFMVPFSLFTGFDFAGASGVCRAVSPKLYTMHWSLIVEFWGRELLDSNPGLDERLLVRSLENLFDLTDTAGAAGLSDYGYPEPHEPHPIANTPQIRKIRQVQTEVSGRCLVTPLVHGYGPDDDFCRRFQIVADSTADGVWVNRYGYLSDRKLEAIGRIWRDTKKIDDG
jgi:hypothetical protein